MLVFGPVSVEEILLLVFVYDPAVAPVTVTLIVHVLLAVMVPPESEMVRGEVRVKVPVVQAVEVPEVTVNPEGKTSEKETPVKEVVVFGFAIVNVNVLVLPVLTLVGEKLLDMVGTVGRGQPVIVMPSRYIVPVVTEGLPPYCAPAANTLKYTVVLFVVAVVFVIPVCHAFPLFHAPVLVFAEFQVEPSVLNSTYQLPEFDQLPCKL